MPLRGTNDATIGERIQGRRELRGWSIRLAADRAGLSPSTWSRIERGLRGVDNRFVLSDIAAALECSVADLAGHPAAAHDRDIAQADSTVPAVLAALIETAPDERPSRPAKPLAELQADVDVARDLYRQCDHVGLIRQVPDLLLDLHAAQTGAEARTVLGLSVQLHLITMATLKHMGHPAEAWIAAERGRAVAAMIGSPVAAALAEFGRTCAATGADGYGRAYTLAQRAVDDLSLHLDQPHAVEALGLLTLRVAYAAGGTHRPAESAEAFDEARRIADRTGEAHSWDMFFGPTNVATWKMSVELDTGDPGRALEIGAGVNPARFGAPVRQSAFHLDMARAFARIRRDDDAVRSLLVAERLAPQRVRVMPVAREMARTMMRRPAGSKLRGFAERAGLSR